MPPHSEVCDDEATEWRRCVESQLGNPKARPLCVAHERAFDACVEGWRRQVGPSVQVKGANEGDPPPQCAAMSCLVGECLRQFDYDFARCKPPMECFKHCVKGYYGNEYIVS